MPKHENNPPRLEKTYDASVKTTGRSGTALVSVFMNTDKQGDRVTPGAFKRTIAEWKAKMAKGLKPPFVWSHQWSDPDAYLGPITGLRETSSGLEVDFEITAETETAKQVQYLLREGLVNQMSFAYEVWDEQRAKDGSNELLELDLIEAGPTLRGANDQTDLLALKNLTTDLESKATFKPWQIEERGGKYCVIKDSGDTVKKCHPTREKAVAHLRAVYAAKGLTSEGGEKASEDDAILRAHLRSNHAMQGRMLLRQFSIPDLIRTHRLYHVSDARRATETHLRTGLPESKSDSEVRAIIAQLDDEYVLPGQLEQLKAEGIISDVRERRRKQEARQRAIRRTEARK